MRASGRLSGAKQIRNFFATKAAPSAPVVVKTIYKWMELVEGKTLRGTVKNLTEYGAFIDLGGIDA